MVVHIRKSVTNGHILDDIESLVVIKEKFCNKWSYILRSVQHMVINGIKYLFFVLIFSSFLIKACSKYKIVNVLDLSLFMVL